MRHFFTSCLFGITSLAVAQTHSIQLFATGFTKPVEISHPDNDSRLFIVEQEGVIKILNSDGTINSEDFLNLTTKISNTGERGLLGLAFHPNYASNGYFYLNYTNLAGNTEVARYSVDTNNPNKANPIGTVLLTVNQPLANHNGGTIKFGPDGYLYIGMGDGGGSGDPNNYSQNINENLGKMLRIDVDNGTPYGIPPSNPYVGIDGNDEIWATGLRNPWKFSFNRLNGDLWIADVGQNKVEEINKVTNPLTAGLNFGWRCYEGTQAYNTNGCIENIMTMPYAEYLHNEGCSITGGYYYTGSKYPNFKDTYIFADYCKNRLASVDNNGKITYSALFEGFNNFSTFGEDNNGELYVAAINNGNIYKIVDTSLDVESFNDNFFSMVPNPANNQIAIESQINLNNPQIIIYDMLGRNIIQQQFNNEKILMNISTLENGTYLIILKENHKIRMQKKLVKD